MNRYPVYQRAHTPRGLERAGARSGRLIFLFVTLFALASGLPAEPTLATDGDPTPGPATETLDCGDSRNQELCVECGASSGGVVLACCFDDDCKVINKPTLAPTGTQGGARPPLTTTRPRQSGGAVLENAGSARTTKSAPTPTVPMTPSVTRLEGLPPSRAMGTAGSADANAGGQLGAGGQPGGIHAPGPAGGGANVSGQSPEPLPDGGELSKIWIDREIGTVELAPGAEVVLKWDVSDVPNANGIAVLVSDRVADCDADSAAQFSGRPGSGIYRATTGTFRFVPDIPGSERFTVSACAFDRTGGNDVILPRASNAIVANIVPRPDLVMAGFEIFEGDKVRFTVKNEGPGTKPPGELFVQLIRTKNPEDPHAYSNKWAGLAGETSKATLNAGEVGPRDVVGNMRFDMSGGGTLKLCINAGRKVVESDHANNCKEIATSDMYADLVVLDAELVLKKRPGKGRRIWKGITNALSFEFKGSPVGLMGDDEGLIYTVANRGSVATPESRARIDLTADGVSIWSSAFTIPPIDAGGSATIHLVLNRRSDGTEKVLRGAYGDACCNGSIEVDSGNEIVESTEANNKHFFTGPGLTRDPVRDNR